VKLLCLCGGYHLNFILQGYSPCRAVGGVPEDSRASPPFDTERGLLRFHASSVGAMLPTWQEYATDAMLWVGGNR